MKRQIVIIGGGASGLFAAITAARAGAFVTILEHKEKIGKKIGVTGNGKCNLSNLSFSDSDYYSDTPEFLPGIFKKFGVSDTISFFEGAGLLLKEQNGYLYPLSEQAATVTEVLKREIRRLHIKVKTECSVLNIKEDKKGFQVHTTLGDFYGDALILACGGKAAPKTGSDGSGYTLAKAFGIQVIEPLPALVQLRCKETYLKQVAGVRCEARLTLFTDGKESKRESGELQLVEYGISGIPVFQISRIAAKALAQGKKVTVSVDLFPKLKERELYQFLMKIPCEEKESVEEILLGIANRKLMTLLCSINEISLKTPWKQIKQQEALIRKFVHSMKSWRVTVKETNPFENAQVCCGGVDLKEVTPNLEAKKKKGLYFAGEILDVDGICGGYNLQWAWSSGYVAGQAAACGEKND